jgi:4-deoxy-L-threo-5-hexosulose-uronate ketol-isomerase
MEIRYASHPTEVKKFETTRLREEFLIETLFVPGILQLVYSHVDRFITGGVIPLANRRLYRQAGPFTAE